MIPRFGRPPEPGHHYRARPGAYALLVRDGQALLTMQTRPIPELQLPGGGVDPGESPLAALHREVREETGWSIAPISRLGAYRRFAWLPDYGYRAEKICTVWLGRPILRKGKPMEPDHIDIWLPLSELPDALTDPGAKALLARFLRGQRTGP